MGTTVEGWWAEPGARNPATVVGVVAVGCGGGGWGGGGGGSSLLGPGMNLQTQRRERRGEKTHAHLDGTKAYKCVRIRPGGIAP